MAKRKLTTPIFGILASAGLTISPAASRAADDTKLTVEWLKTFSADENVVISPWSASNAFALIHAGSAGETAREISNLFGFKRDSKETASELSKETSDIVNRANTRGASLHVANRIWNDTSLKPSPTYLVLIKENYSAEPEAVDFKTKTGRETAVRAVNTWAESNTNGKIKKLLSPSIINPSTRAILTNAVYLYAPWKNEFDPYKTTPGDFHSPKKKLRTPFMHMMSINLPYYAESGNFRAVRLPYKNGLVMSILLPDEKKSVHDLLGSLTPEKLQTLRRSYRAAELDLALPKFKFENDLDMTKTLEQLGLKTAFSLKADFTPMVASDSPPLMLSKAIQKTIIEVNEKGTEAAAATAVMVALGAAVPQPKIPMRIDRPFLFLIEDPMTNRILFAGQVARPTP